LPSSTSTPALWTAPIESAKVSPTPTDVSDTEATASPTPTLPTGPLPSLGPTPSTTWKGINWIAIPGGHSPALPAPTGWDDSRGTLESWSKGYVEFMWDSHSRVLNPWASSDGLNWKSGHSLDISPWKAYFHDWDTLNGPTDPSRDECMIFPSLVEGPSSLLMSSDILCNGGTEYCGISNLQLLWTSSDGLSWDLVNPKAFAAGSQISGGDSGFVALKATAGKPALWTSSDGRTWNRATLPSAIHESASSSDVAASFAGGFVLPAALIQKKGDRAEGSCEVGPADQSTNLGALWWSPDGTTWTRDSLDIGGVKGAVEMRVYSIDDQTLLADETVWTTDGSWSSDLYWASHDGKNWTLLQGMPNGGYPAAGRDRGLFCSWGPGKASTLSVIDAGLNVVVLKQTGSIPWIDNWQMAPGPNGVLVTDDGSRFWMGVPTTG
jgi:hypothetical protein